MNTIKIGGMITLIAAFTVRLYTPNNSAISKSLIRIGAVVALGIVIIPLSLIVIISLFMAHCFRWFYTSSFPNLQSYARGFPYLG